MRRWQSVARLHWTPVEACVRAAQLVRPGEGERVLDVGSGGGNFCTVGALTTPGTFVGIEQRASLVRRSRRLARATGAARALFVHGDAFSIEWSSFQALYFFNPFAELETPVSKRIDDEIVFGAARLESCRRKTRARLARMPVGTRVVVFYDLGLNLPAGYTRRHAEQVGEHPLELWVKERALTV